MNDERRTTLRQSSGQANYKALIIAAGDGGRLREGGRDTPKPLRKAIGLPMLLRVILTAREAGVRKFVVVLGYEAEQIRSVLERRVPSDISVEYVYNPNWKKGNGTSALAAKPCIEGDFFLLMSDHVFDPNILKGFAKSGRDGSDVVLAVDKKINRIVDIDDATKTLLDGDRIMMIHKKLKEFSAIDTGIFLCSPALFEALKKSQEAWDYSLSGGMRVLATRGRMKAYDIGDAWWQDVDTEADLKQAKRYLVKSCIKKTDGFVSRYFNRKISAFISGYLARTSLTPNQMTMIGFLVALVSGILISVGEYWAIVTGAVLFKFSSIIDGCDGEIAKLKFQSSKFGEWFDTVCDNVSYVFFFVCVAIGAVKQGTNPYIIPISLSALFGVIATLAVMYLFLIKHTKSGSLVYFQGEIEGGWFAKLVSNIKFVTKRDFFSLIFMLIAFAGRLDIILILAAVGANIAWIVVLLTRQPAPALPRERVTAEG